MQPNSDELDALSDLLREAGGAIGYSQLLGHLARMMLARASLAPIYNPTRGYDVGQSVTYQGQMAEVVAVRRCWNPRQGAFSVVDLCMPDGENCRLAADVATATLAHQSADAGLIRDKSVAVFLQAHGGTLLQALLADPRFVDLRAPDGFCSTSSSMLPDNASFASGSRGLFSRQVLADYLRDYLESGEHARSVADSRFEELQAYLAEAVAEGAAWDSGETWRRFVGPVLRLLGWSAETLLPARSYGLVAAPGLGFSESQIDPSGRQPAAILRLVRWGANLGGEMSDQAADCPPIELIGRLFRDGVDWGILTNGRQWRLYRSSRGDPDVGCTAAEYLEVDLGGILRAIQADDCLREAQQRSLWEWWAIFEARGFVSRGMTPSAIERLKRESAMYARDTMRKLRARLVALVLPEIAGGFVAYRAQQLGVRSESQDTLRDILQAGLGLIVRLFFLLYAESRSALPMHNPDYRRQSLQTLQHWALERVNGERPLASDTEFTACYDHLMALFRYLEHGAADLDLPSYDGGVFDALDPVSSFLERHRLSDRVVARVLAALSQVGDDVVDYTALSVRRLVAVCEGLLGCSLQVVSGSAGRVVLVGDDGLPFKPAGKSLPDYIGVSSVERALDQVLADRAVAFGKAMSRVVALRRQLDTTCTEGVASSAALSAAEQVARSSLLDVRVLDPASRGGVLLVLALDVMTDGLIGILADYHASHPNVPWSWNPVCCDLFKVSIAVLTDAMARGIGVDGLHIDTTAVLTRMIAERSLCGVDLRPTAVAMTRAGLQMRAFMPGASLLTLGRQLQCGNSLCGVRISDFCDQVPALGHVRADLAATYSAAISQGQSGAIVDDALAPYNRLLTLWLSERFGNQGAESLVRRQGSQLLAALRHEIPLEPPDAEIVANAERLGADERFLHWDVAFPQVFAMPSDGDIGHAGFDVVLGHPPSEVELGTVVGSASGLSYGFRLPAEPRGPFAQLAALLSRKPGGRVALVISPAEVGD